MQTSIIKFGETTIPSLRFRDEKFALSLYNDRHKELVLNFNSNVRSGKIKTECIDCLCGSNKSNKIASIDCYGFVQSTVLCQNCGLMFSNPRLTNDEYEKFYTSDFYRLVYEGDSFISSSKQRNDTNIKREIFENISKFTKIDKAKSIFEFGAGGGWNLPPFIEAGAQVSGVDYSEGLSKLAQSKGINVTQGSLNDIQGKFDIIILNHVFEHFSYPVENLKLLLTHLKPDGIIYIGVPNIMKFSIGQLQNAHTYYFSPNTFRHYVSQAGLEIVQSGDAEGIHMYGIFEFSKNTSVPVASMQKHYKEIAWMLAIFKTKYWIKKFLHALHLRHFPE
jgi:2-polyprenyl-3-methyl-5-hydroxy-6-metoxy-1,4-benzoquinol methylase